MEQACWICLQEETASSQLVQPCACPRWVHPQCLARWQLQQAGKREEKNCRFCNGALGDWRGTLTPEELKSELDKIAPVMEVYCAGRYHRIVVHQGPEGLQQFQRHIRRLFNLADDVEMNFTFGMKDPMSGDQLRLEGCGAFDAAVHCASVAAAVKCLREQERKATKIKSSRRAGTVASSSMGQSPGDAATRRAQRCPWKSTGSEAPSAAHAATSPHDVATSSTSLTDHAEVRMGACERAGSTSQATVSAPSADPAVPLCADAGSTPHSPTAASTGPAAQQLPHAGSGRFSCAQDAFERLVRRVRPVASVHPRQWFSFLCGTL